jgi:hypothetical protein
VFVQMRGKPPGKFVLVGGARVEKSGVLAESIVQVLQRLQEKRDPSLSELELNIASYEGVKFHRIKGGTMSARDRRLYGDDSAMYIGAGEGALWFAVGGVGALDALRDVVMTVVEPRKPGENKDPNAPFQLVMNLSSWLEMTAPSDTGADLPAAPEGANERLIARRNRFRKLAADAFAQGGDKLRLEVKPTETGAHLRVTLEEGFVRLLGLAISSRVDQRQPPSTTEPAPTRR